MRRAHWWMAAALGLAVTFGGAPHALAATETLKFQFHPPDGLVKVDTVKTTQTLDLGEGRKRGETAEVQIKYVFATTEHGYSVTETLLSGRSPAGDTAQTVEIFKDVPLTYQVDATGRMQSVSGVDRLLEGLKKKLPAEEYASVSQLLTPDLLLKSGKADWDAEVADFVGRPAQVGAAWVSVEEFPWPDGTVIQYYAAKKVTGQVTVQGKPCVRVATSYSTNPEELKGFLGAAGAAALAGLKPLPGKAKVSGEGQRAVDPATLIWYDGKARRWVQAPATLPNAGTVTVTLTQEKEYKVTVTPPKP